MPVPIHLTAHAALGLFVYVANFDNHPGVAQAGLGVVSLFAATPALFPKVNEWANDYHVNLGLTKSLPKKQNASTITVASTKPERHTAPIATVPSTPMTPLQLLWRGILRAAGDEGLAENVGGGNKTTTRDTPKTPETLETSLNSEVTKSEETDTPSRDSTVTKVIEIITVHIAQAPNATSPDTPSRPTPQITEGRKTTLTDEPPSKFQSPSFEFARSAAHLAIDFFLQFWAFIAFCCGCLGYFGRSLVDRIEEVPQWVTRIWKCFWFCRTLLPTWMEKYYAIKSVSLTDVSNIYDFLSYDNNFVVFLERTRWLVLDIWGHLREHLDFWIMIPTLPVVVVAAYVARGYWRRALPNIHYAVGAFPRAQAFVKRITSNTSCAITWPFRMFFIGLGQTASFPLWFTEGVRILWPIFGPSLEWTFAFACACTLAYRMDHLHCPENLRWNWATPMPILATAVLTSFGLCSVYVRRFFRSSGLFCAVVFQATTFAYVWLDDFAVQCTLGCKRDSIAICYLVFVSLVHFFMYFWFRGDAPVEGEAAEGGVRINHQLAPTKQARGMPFKWVLQMYRQTQSTLDHLIFSSRERIPIIRRRVIDFTIHAFETARLVFQYPYIFAAQAAQGPLITMESAWRRRRDVFNNTWLLALWFGFAVFHLTYTSCDFPMRDNAYASSHFSELYRSTRMVKFVLQALIPLVFLCWSMHCRRWWTVGVFIVIQLKVASVYYQKRCSVEVVYAWDYVIGSIVSVVGTLILWWLCYWRCSSRPDNKAGGADDSGTDPLPPPSPLPTLPQKIPRPIPPSLPLSPASSLPPPQSVSPTLPPKALGLSPQALDALPRPDPITLLFPTSSGDKSPFKAEDAKNPEDATQKSEENWDSITGELLKKDDPGAPRPIPTEGPNSVRVLRTNLLGRESNISNMRRHAAKAEAETRPGPKATAEGSAGSAEPRSNPKPKSSDDDKNSSRSLMPPVDDNAVPNDPGLNADPTSTTDDI